MTPDMEWSEWEQKLAIAGEAVTRAFSLMHMPSFSSPLPLVRAIQSHHNNQSSVRDTCLYFSPREESLTKPWLFLKDNLSPLFQKRKWTWTMCTRWWHQLLTRWIGQKLRVRRTWGPPRMIFKKVGQWASMNSLFLSVLEKLWDMVICVAV